MVSLQGLILLRRITFVTAIISIFALGAVFAYGLSNDAVTKLSACSSGYMKNMMTLEWAPVDGASGYQLIRDSVTVAQAGPTAVSTRFSVNPGTHKLCSYAQVPTTTATTTVVHQQAAPYDSASPWNTPIQANPTIDPKSQTYINAIADNGLPLTSDPDQYTIGVFPFDNSTPLSTVTGTGFYSTYDAGDSSRVGHGSPWSAQVPVPTGATSPPGSDGQVIFYDATNGTEYGFWQFSGNKATNGYRYHTTEGYNGRFADGLAGRGDGTPYLAGLVRKWEVDQGHIDHALAFAYNSPSSAFVYPASKSDGGNFGGVLGTDLPEGSHLQLDPSLTDPQLVGYGLNSAGLVIAHALQKYGMFVVDHSGSSKVYLEYRGTAGWGSDITRSMLSGIPWSVFRVVE